MDRVGAASIYDRAHQPHRHLARFYCTIAKPPGKLSHALPITAQEGRSDVLAHMAALSERVHSFAGYDARGKVGP